MSVKPSSPGKPALAEPRVQRLGGNPGQEDGQSIASTQQDPSAGTRAPGAAPRRVPPAHRQQEEKNMLSMRF